jgi:hypothetical protein
LKYGRRGDPPAVLLKDGRVLIAGGFTGGGWTRTRTSELYDPETGTWSLTGSMKMGYYGSMVLLQDGRVLHAARGSSEIYDPATGEWSLTGYMIKMRGEGMTLTLLPDGKVLAVGGLDPWEQAYRECELYDPETGIWTQIGDMRVARILPAVVVLVDGTVLVTGGNDEVRGVSITEVFDPEKMDPERIASLQSELKKTQNHLRLLGAATFTLLLVLVGTSVTIYNKKGPKEGNYRNTQLKEKEKK